MNDGKYMLNGQERWVMPGSTEPEGAETVATGGNLFGLKIINYPLEYIAEGFNK